MTGVRGLLDVHEVANAVASIALSLSHTLRYRSIFLCCRVVIIVVPVTQRSIADGVIVPSIHMDGVATGHRSKNCVCLDDERGMRRSKVFARNASSSKAKALQKLPSAPMIGYHPIPANGMKKYVEQTRLETLHSQLCTIIFVKLGVRPAAFAGGSFDMLNEEFRKHLPIRREDPWGTVTSARASHLFVLRTALLTVHMHLARLAVATDGYGIILDRLLESPAVTYPSVAEAVAQLCLELVSLQYSGALLSPMARDVGTACLRWGVTLGPFLAALPTPTPSYPMLENTAHITVCVPYLPTMLPYFINRMRKNVAAMVAACSEFTFDVVYCTDKIAKESTDYTPWSRVARVRNLMVSRIDLEKTDYVLWVDSDLVSYPPDFPRRAIRLNPGNITAPTVLVDGSLSFYDWCGFIGKDQAVMTPPASDAASSIGYIPGRNIGVVPNFSGKPDAAPYQPHNPAFVSTYHPNERHLVEIDCCGAMYIMPASILRRDHVDKTYAELSAVMAQYHVAPSKKVRFEDHPCFTDHFSVCQAHRDNGGKIYMDLGSIAMHANLPEYGIPWAGAGPR